MYRYHYTNDVLDMCWQKGIQLIQKAFEKQEKEKVWQMWLNLYPYMAMNLIKFIPFSKFYQKTVKSGKDTNLTTEEVITRAEKIKEADRKRKS